jgi:ABC-2 type transport system permease protein
MTGDRVPSPAQEAPDMTATLTPPAPTAARPTARRTGPSLPAMVGIEMRKSLSTRSGRALAAASMLLAPVGVGVVAASSTGAAGAATGPITVMGLLTAYVLLSIGVLSTAGEWGHRTVQTTFLLVPHRGTVLAAKAVAVTLMSAAFAAVSSALTVGVLALVESGVTWDGAPRAMIVVVLSGAALAVIGAGVGAALASTPGALTGLYVLILGALPILQQLKPTWADKIDPATSVFNLAQGAEQTRSIVILAGWVVVASMAGWILTHRRAVQ